MMNDVAVWVAIFILGLLCLNWPLLGIFHHPFVYLLVFWLFFVFLVAWAARGGKAPPAR
jgi:hypothetical protein